MHVSWNLVDNVYLTNNSKQAENKILEITSVYKICFKAVARYFTREIYLEKS